MLSELLIFNPTGSLSDKMVNVDLYDLNGEKFDKEELFTGKVLLVFISSDCSACQAETVQLTNFYPTIINQIKIYAMSVDPIEKANEFNNLGNHPGFQILVDKDRIMTNALLLRGVPTKILIKDGIIEKVLLGKFVDEADIKKKIF